jgi:hypothetical protein
MVLIEGVSARHLLELPDVELDALLFTKEPIVFAVGSVRVLGRARLELPRLVVELSHIDGGGEGVLRSVVRRSIGSANLLAQDPATAERPTR